MSTSRGYHSVSWGYFEYIRRCSIHQKNIMSASSGYRDSLMGDILSTLGYVQYSGGIL